MKTDFHTVWRASDGTIRTGGFAESTGTYGTLGYHLDNSGTPSTLTGQSGTASSQQTTTSSSSTTTSITTVTTTVSVPAEGKAGDANCDGTVNLSDAILVLQVIGNPDTYGVSGTEKSHITADGIANADVSSKGDGLTNMDALAIQRYLLKLISVLPES